MESLYDLPLGACPDNEESNRLITAKRRLAKFTGSSFVDSSLTLNKDEDQIILDQSN